MLKFRLSYLLWAAFFGLIGYQLVSEYIDKEWLQNTVIVIVFILSGAGIIPFMASFTRAHIEPDGSICFNTNNWYWKLMIGFFGKDFMLDNRGCLNYWLTGVAFMVFSIIGLIVLIISYGIFNLLKWAYITPGYEIANDVASGLPIVGIIAVVFFACLGLCICAQLLVKRHKIFEVIFDVVMAILLTLVIGFIAVFIPIDIISISHDKTFGAASILYLRYVALGILGLIAMAALAWAAFKFLPMLKNHWLGQLIQDKVCVRVTTCSTEDTQ